MAIALINGIRTHGDGNVDLLGHRLSTSHKIIDITLPKRGHLSARWGRNTRTDAQIIYQATENVGEPIDVIAHSYGCLRVLTAAERRRFRSLFLFRPALSVNYDLGNIPNSPKVYCFHSGQDMAIRIGSWLPFHPFGRAGTHGMLDPAVINKPSRGGHSADFIETLITEWTDYINAEIASFDATTGANGL